MTKAKKSVKPFVMPRAGQGSSVIFYPCKPSTWTPETEGQMALVVAEHDQGLRLAIIPPDTLGFKCPDDAIRHKNDPLAESHFDGDSGDDAGFWDFNPRQLCEQEVSDVRLLLRVFGTEVAEHRRMEAEAEAKAGEVADAPLPAAAA